MVAKAMKPSKDNRKKFDIDLEYGEAMEGMVADMFQKKKIEVKSEKGLWHNTGNIVIEYQSWGKPSGIEATEADYWFHNLSLGDDLYVTLAFEVAGLKRIIANNKFRSVQGGDHKASRMWLIPLKKLFEQETFEAFRSGKA